MTRQYWANMALCFVLGALVIFSITRFGSVLTPKGLFGGYPEPSREAAELLQDVVLTRYQIGESLKNIVEADFYIQNNADRNVKNINVLCEFYNEDGKYMDREQWILPETVPAMHQLKITSVSRRFVNTGARALKCSLVDLQVVEKPLFTLERHVSEGHGESSGSSTHGEKAPSAH